MTPPVPCRLRARAARGRNLLRRERDPDVLAGYLQDAARYPGGFSDEVCFPASERDVAALLAEGRPLLVVGAQSSLTGGATPRGEIIVSTSRLAGIGQWTASSVRCGAGVVLRDLDAACAARGVCFPPVPTYDGATVGGAISTDAAGAATFRHGTVRAWVEAVTVVLASGEVLDVERGQVRAGDEDCFEIESVAGEITRVPLPRVTTPAVAKSSAGYRGGQGLDLIDLFIGSEGTLGVVTEARLRVLAPRPAWLAALVPVSGDEEALALTRELRMEAAAAAAGDSGRADVAAIEYMDERCVEILREDAVPARVGVPLAPGARALLLVQVDLPAAYDRAAAVAEVEAGSGGPLASFCRVLEARGLLEAAVVALPGEEDRRRALFALREAVPAGVNARVRDASLRSAGAVAKSGGDVIVPFERLGEALATWRTILESTGLDSAIWGHISDGNVHPNLIAAEGADMAAAASAQLAIGKAAIALGGSPLAEHGTGRNRAKQELLAALHGQGGVESMRATKRALDPCWLLSPGVLFEPS